MNNTNPAEATLPEITAKLKEAAVALNEANYMLSRSRPYKQLIGQIMKAAEAQQPAEDQKAVADLLILLDAFNTVAKLGSETIPLKELRMRLVRASIAGRFGKFAGRLISHL